jgi:type III restriction enzyme
VQVSPAEIDATVAQAQVTALAGKARIDTASGEITVLVPLDKEDAEKLASCVKRRKQRRRCRSG